MTLLLKRSQGWVSSVPSILLSLLLRSCMAWLSTPTTTSTLSCLHRHTHPHLATTTTRRKDSTRLFSGTGKAKGYKWQEEAFEIDVTVKVPQETRAKDLIFQANPRSIDLRLKQANGQEKVLLDGSRTLRGRVSLDGTFWVIGDGVEEDQDIYLASPYRTVTVTIEKVIRTPKDDFEVVEYDWKGVYLDDEEEVFSRTYDGPEELNVREYASSIGVDIDNMNMSMVDKSMFSSGLNLTQSSMDELSKAGLLTEVTQQADGSEFVTNAETGQAEPLDSLGRNSRSVDPSTKGNQQPDQKTSKIPFLDTNSPWHNAIPVNETSRAAAQFLEKDTADQSSDIDKDSNEEDVVEQKRYFTRAAFAQDAAQQPKNGSENYNKNKSSASDPIDLLTVKKLKEVLKSQGLKVSGNKKELQDRLRQQVNSLLQGQQGDQLPLDE